MIEDMLDFIEGLANKYDEDQYDYMTEFFEENGDASDFGHSDDCLHRGISVGANEVYREAFLFLESISG